MLLSNVDVSQILAITFTNAAANDIREELFSRVNALKAGSHTEIELFSEILSVDGESLRDMAEALRMRLIRQFSLLQISTIHSFFARLIGCFPRETGVIDFTVIDDPDRELLIEESMLRFFDMLHGNTKLTNRMFTLLTSRGERGIWTTGKFRTVYDLVHARYYMLESLMQALDENIEKIETDFFKLRGFLLSPKYRRILESLMNIIEGYLNERGEKNHPRRFVQTLQDFLRNGTIRTLTESAPFRDYGASGLKNYLQRIAENLPEHDRSRFLRFFQDAWRGLSNFHMAEMRYRAYTWLDVYVLIQRIYDSLKEPAHAIDFTDIELIARDFLTGLTDFSYFHRRIESGTRYVLIDEFQDTSELQWSTLRPLVSNSMAQGGTLFYVGDVKQSIYRWRGGEPYLFDRVKEELGIQEAFLPYSYRQNRVLLDFVNRIFRSLSEETGGNFHYQEQHLPPQIEDREQGYVHILSFAQKEELMENVCEQIRRLSESNVELDDIAVLCRKNAEVADIEHLLRDQGIPFNSAGRTRLLDDYCIRDMVNTLRLVIDPDEPLFLAGLLRAPFFRLRYTDMLELCKDGQHAIMQQLKVLNPSVWEKVQTIIRLSRYTTPSGFLMNLYGELDVFSVYPGKREPLLAFLELAYAFESGRDSVRLGDFDRYLQDNDRYITLRAGDHGGVTVQTIHSAKGLEYHSVILPFLTQRAHAALDGSLLCGRDRDGKIGRFAIANRVYVDYFAHRTEIEHLQHENDLNYQIDEINTLYVAFTRAKENLVVLPLLRGRGESIGGMMLRVLGVEADGELRMGKPVASSKTVEEFSREFVPARETTGAATVKRDEVREFPEMVRRGRREGLLRGLIFHAVIEMIQGLPLNGEELERLLRIAASREGRGYTGEEVASAVKEVRPMVLNVIADQRLEKYFYDRAMSELNIFSSQYQNLLGRIDRIHLGEEIDVIDFKTNPVNSGEELEKLSEMYGEQVASYCSTLSHIFPGKKVHGYLYFTGASPDERLVQV
jgi:ATP-dependent exoDNAse (exonuclease V) beta subunit